MNKPKPKSINPQPPAGNALDSEKSRKPRAPKSFTTGGDAAQPASTTNEDAGAEWQNFRGDYQEEPSTSTTNEDTGSAEISPEERQRMIEEAAYYCAQRRQAQGGEGTVDDDWAEAEAQIERMLKERRNKN
ncbi:MAG: DUF2934 domain-containing protein [Burkholderiales bacterium]